MSTALQKDEEAQDRHPKELEQETQIQGIETEADHPEKEKGVSATLKQEQEETPQEKTKGEEVAVSTGLEQVKLPVQSGTEQTPMEASKPATKRKFDTRNSATESSINDHHKPKKSCATKLMKKTTATTTNHGGTTKTRDFSFARPTESSARRTAALAENQTKNIKATPPPCKLQQMKRTSAHAQCEPTPTLKTPTDTNAAEKAASRAHFSYTPYTGPLPPLTVESSFAPKNGQGTDRRAWSASPTQTKGAAVARKPRPASAKKTQQQSTIGKEENNSVNTEEDASTNAAASCSQTLIKQGTTGLPVSKEEDCSALKENNAQRLPARQPKSINSSTTTL